MKIAINQNLTKKISLVFTVFALVILFTLVARAAAPSGGYAPGGTLDPDCAPGATDCIVDQGWLVDTTNNYVYNTTDSIGVGTTTPAVPLHLTSGDFLIGNTLAHSSGTELKFIFDKSKGAFRGGSVTNMAWDDANVGVYSFAYGLSPWATATGSVAFGSNSSSTGQASFATGIETISSGTASFASGIYATASGDYAAAFGLSSAASGDYTLAVGGGQASGDSSVAFGGSASGQGSFAMGQVTSSGIASFAFGGSDSMTVSGYYSGALGRGLTASSDDSFTVGRHNVVSGATPNSYSVTDPAFVVGIGTSTSDRKNGVTVLKNGNTGIGATTTLSLSRSLNIFDTMFINPIVNAPSSPVLGDLYVDSDTNELCFYDGSTWTGLKAAGACA